MCFVVVLLFCSQTIYQTRLCVSARAFLLWCVWWLLTGVGCVWWVFGGLCFFEKYSIWFSKLFPCACARVCGSVGCWRVFLVVGLGGVFGWCAVVGWMVRWALLLLLVRWRGVAAVLLLFLLLRAAALVVCGRGREGVGLLLGAFVVVWCALGLCVWCGGALCFRC